MLFFILILALCYVLFIGRMLIGWNKAVRKVEPVQNDDAEERFTIIIAFRNEEKNLPLLLRSLESQEDLSRFSIILVDDHSEDSSRDIVRTFMNRGMEIDVITSLGEGKIAALNSAIPRVDTEMFITLDADVTLPMNWSKRISNELLEHSAMHILPVRGRAGESLSSKYASLDFMALIGVTFATAAIGRPLMANGAQLAYLKEGHKWDSESVSGDDVFSLHELKGQGRKISFALHEDLVATTPMPHTWTDVIEQRLRWSSKASSYSDRDTLVTGWFLLVLNVSIWVLLFQSVYNEKAFYLFLSLLSIKGLFDAIFMFFILRWFKMRTLFTFFPLAFIVNSFLMPVIYVIGRMRGFTWKGRHYR